MPLSVCYVDLSTRQCDPSLALQGALTDDSIDLCMLHLLTSFSRTTEMFIAVVEHGWSSAPRRQPHHSLHVFTWRCCGVIGKSLGPPVGATGVVVVVVEQ